MLTPAAPTGVQADPTALGALAERGLWTLDTTTDTGERSGLLRVVPLLSPALQAQVAVLTPETAPGAEWETWRSHKAIVLPTVTFQPHSGAPPDTGTTAYRSYVVRLAITGRDGWSTSKTEVAFLTLTKTTDGWAVAALTP